MVCLFMLFSVKFNCALLNGFYILRYFDRSDGNLHLPGGKWCLFWYGSKGIADADLYKEMAKDIPPSFIH